MDTAGIVVIVIGVAVVAVVAFVLLRRPSRPDADGADYRSGIPDDAPSGGPGPVTLDPPVRSVTLENDELVVDFAVPLPTDADEWLTRALMSAALETIRRRESEFSLELGERRVTAPMHGLLREINVAEGATVARGQCLLVLEAMKMQHEVQAGIDGVVTSICRAAGTQVAAGELILEIEPAALPADHPK